MKKKYVSENASKNYDIISKLNFNDLVLTNGFFGLLKNKPTDFDW